MVEVYVVNLLFLTASISWGLAYYRLTYLHALCQAGCRVDTVLCDSIAIFSIN